MIPPINVRQVDSRLLVSKVAKLKDIGEIDVTSAMVVVPPSILSFVSFAVLIRVPYYVTAFNNRNATAIANLRIFYYSYIIIVDKRFYRQPVCWCTCVAI